MMGFIPDRIPHIAETAKFVGNASVKLIDQLGLPVIAADPPFRAVPEFKHLRASLSAFLTKMAREVAHSFGVRRLAAAFPP